MRLYGTAPIRLRRGRLFSARQLLQGDGVTTPKLGDQDVGGIGHEQVVDDHSMRHDRRDHADRTKVGSSEVVLR